MARQIIQKITDPKEGQVPEKWKKDKRSELYDLEPGDNYHVKNCKGLLRKHGSLSKVIVRPYAYCGGLEMDFKALRWLNLCLGESIR